MPWTDDMVESLKKMWEDGLSTGEIGKRLGVSKNSIVGKVHRLQLTARPSPIKKKDSEETAPKTKIKSTEKAAKTASPKPESNTPKESPAPKEPAKKAETPKIEPKQNPETKQPKEKGTDAYINVSIPVIHSPKKPGDKMTVVDLDNHTCRWPIGDPKDENFHFCGAPVRIGQTYCEEHAAIAYVKNIKK